MSGTCDLLREQAGEGIAATLKAVDCVASDVTAQAFGRLFGNGGALEAALVIMLTLYVGFFGISLMLGRSNLSVRALMPKIITIGLVLTFATSWVAFSTVFWNLFIGAPDWLASVLTGSEGSATVAFAQKLDVIFIAVQQSTQGTQDFSAFSPPGMMWMGATMLLLGTVGVLVTARIGLALLVAIGPIFVVMALFNGTRGLFTGWLKGLVMLALTPLFAVVGGSIMLELAIPVIAMLTATQGNIDPQAAMAFFMVGAVHLALMAMVIKVGSTMVSGWQVFGLAAGNERASDGESTLNARTAEYRSASAAQAPAGSALGGSRRIDVSAVATGSPANDPGASGGTRRETKVFATTSARGQSEPGSNPVSRTRGIGNRFRPAQTNARILEKSK